ncbi:MAG: hypothetical protein BWK77_05940 [Verrucomicrobia bacterium A1]|nr:MAG: hypothetical protein BWK77_05940 [Verrucomicrobia bacterium A1]
MTIPLDESIRRAEALMASRQNDAAIDLLRAPGAPDDGARCALLARAYFQRGDSRGDVYSSHFFATRAMELGVATAPILAIRAIAAFRKELFAEAADHFGRYVTGRSSGASQFMLGLSLLRLGRAADAVPWIERASAAPLARPEYATALIEARAAAAGGAPAPTHAWTKAPHGLGGPRDQRPLDAPAPYPSSAVSKLLGDASTPKDFDWLARNIPCQKACPAGTDIPGYLDAIYRGDVERAYRINLHDNVFPAILGRVCSRPCEAECRHGWEGLGEPVAICFSKCSASDFRAQKPVVLDPWFPPSGKTVAVIGSGPAGLAAARNPVLMGHGVTVVEIPADTVLLATGQFSDAAWIDAELQAGLVDRDGWLRSGKSPRTALAKLFVAGDFATGASTLIQAIAHGKDCARRVDAFLMGAERLREVARIEDVETTGRIREMDYVPRQPMPSLPVAQRTLEAEVELHRQGGGPRPRPRGPDREPPPGAVDRGDEADLDQPGRLHPLQCVRRGLPRRCDQRPARQPPHRPHLRRRRHGRYGDVAAGSRRCDPGSLPIQGSAIPGLRGRNIGARTQILGQPTHCGNEDLKTP